MVILWLWFRGWVWELFSRLFFFLWYGDHRDLHRTDTLFPYTTLFRACRGDLPGGHQQWEVPRNDLADDAERLAEMISDGVGVDRRDRAFLCADEIGRAHV